MKNKISIISIIVILIVFCIINIFYKYELRQSDSINILDRNGNLLYQTKNDDSRTSSFGSLDEVPQFIQELVLFREDRRFYWHLGIDPIGILRATYNDVKNRNFSQGASTIDQQVIKLSGKSFKRNFSQKLKEMVLAVNLNFHHSKKEILLYYINNLPFGNGIYGFRTACNAYFGRDCENLSKGELLYIFMFTKYGKKTDVSEQSFALAQKMGLKDYSLDDFKNIKKSLQWNISNKAPFYIDYILDNYDLSQLSGTNIQTSFDYDLYQTIDGEIKNLKNFFGSKKTQDMCAVVLDSDGNILSMNQMKDFGEEKGGFVNYCLSKRQVGSAMKPFLYALSFQRQIYTPNDYIIDGAVSYDIGNGNQYTPQNFDRGFHGEVTISQALGNSLNVPAVKVLDKVGLPQYRDFLREIGNFVGTSEKRTEDYSTYGLSLALGTKEISPLDFAKMWTIFVKTPDQDSSFIYKYGQSLQQTKDILSNNANRLISFGVDNWLNIDGAFGKTGTSRNLVDGRTCGGINDKIVCVWAGNYDNAQMQDSGINTAGIIRNHIIEILKNYN